MIILKRLALFLLFVSLLFVAACTAESEPSVAGDTTTISPTTELVPTLEPTATTMAEVAATAVPTEPAVTVESDGLNAFLNTLQTALTSRDFDLLRSLMSDPFAFGNYGSEWQQQSPADIQGLLENWLPAGAVVQFSPSGTDLTAMLDGQNPQTMLGSDVPVAAAWHTTGWGADGKGEVILFAEETADGQIALKAMLYAPLGFLPEFDDLPVQDEQPAPIGLLYSPAAGGIWQIGADGQPQQLTAQQDAVPAPDGRHAFYVADESLWLIDLASDERTQLTNPEAGIYLAGTQQWADNEMILAGIWLNLETESGPNWGHPAWIDIVSGELTLIDEPAQFLMRSRPAVSATGSVAFDQVGRTGDDRDFNWIYQPETGLMNFVASDFVNATDNTVYTSPALSADGRFLAWLASTGNNLNQLAVFDLESGSVANLPAYQGVGFGGPYPNPVISPDPNWIALRQITVDQAKMGLWLYTQDGQEPVFIAQNGGESVWANEHLLLFIDYDENNNAQLQQYNALTGVRSAVTLPDVVKIFGVVEP